MKVSKQRAIELIDQRINQFTQLLNTATFDNQYNEDYTIAYYGTETLLTELFSKEEATNFRTSVTPLVAFAGGKMDYAKELKDYKKHLRNCISQLKVYRERVQNFWQDEIKEATTATKTGGAKIELIMGDKYEAVQAGAMGPGAHAHDMNFNQVWNQLHNSIDLPSLVSELSELRAELKEKATDPEHDIAVGSLALAEQAAKKGDGSKTLEYLAKAGKWALDAATQIGTTVAAEAIKKSIGM